ncbi:MAG TPA: serine/threonine-protein kinase [Myxococcaceae bacterium]|nr:serine/threonine-protein kinase [Myxococcaceae bacterium]
MGGSVPRLPRGATLGRYVVLECLGSGGMGVVYRAHDFALDRRVSLKLLRPSGKDPDARRERLVSEAQALARVSHPNVLAVHDVGTWENEVYLALEHVEGETLRSWLDRAPRSPAEIRGMFLQAARGLQAIHDAGLVHRDVKPENLLVGRDGRLRVADLGLAITTGGSAPAPAHETLRPGTPGYMPLEQHRGEPLDPRADQFSLAVAIHEALLGYRPHGSRGASREVLEARLARGPALEVPRSPAIPPRLRRALTASLSPDRAGRPASLALLIDALAAPGVRASSTLGGSLAVAASAVLLVVAMVRGSATPVARAEAAPWLPPAYEFQVETLEPPEPVVVLAGAPAFGAGGAPGRESWTSSRAAASSQAAALATPSAPVAQRPEVLIIGHRTPEHAAASAEAPALDLGKLAELRGLVQALYRALSEPREGMAGGPLLALSPNPATGGAGSTPVATSAAPVQIASAATPYGSGPDFVDPTGQTIAAIERRLDQQIRHNRSPPEIAQTRFALAQAIWNSSDTEQSQIRALSLARQSKAELDAVAGLNANVSLLELRAQVNDWISLREGPVGKPRGNLTVETRRDGLGLPP